MAVTRSARFLSRRISSSGGGSTYFARTRWPWRFWIAWRTAATWSCGRSKHEEESLERQRKRHARLGKDVPERTHCRHRSRDAGALRPGGSARSREPPRTEFCGSSETVPEVQGSSTYSVLSLSPLTRLPFRLTFSNRPRTVYPAKTSSRTSAATPREADEGRVKSAGRYPAELRTATSA